MDVQPHADGSFSVEAYTTIRNALTSLLESKAKEIEENVRDQIENERLHHERKLLDGFAHPKDCEMCKTAFSIVRGKTEQYKCQSYVEDGKVIDCTCGKCFLAHPTN